MTSRLAALARPFRARRRKVRAERAALEAARRGDSPRRCLAAALREPLPGRLSGCESILIAQAAIDLLPQCRAAVRGEER